MKSILIDGTACQFFIEKASDGGAVLNTLVPTADGEYLNYRHWFSSPDAARAEFASLAGEKSAARVAKARESGISGRIHGKPITG